MEINSRLLTGAAMAWVSAFLPGRAHAQIIAGNNPITDGALLDGWSTVLYIDETHRFDFTGTGQTQGAASQFKFWTRSGAGIATPFIVEVTGPNTFIVRLIGTTRIGGTDWTSAGLQAFPFDDGGAPMVQQGWAAGFMTANSDGSNGAATIPFSYSIVDGWLTGSSNGSGPPTLTVGQPPTLGASGTFNDAAGLRAYSFQITASLLVPAPPTDIVATSAFIPAGLPLGSGVAVLSAMDPNAGDSHTFALVAGTGDTDNARFSISGNILTLAQTAGPGGATYSIRLRATDSTHLTFEKSLTFNVLTLVGAGLGSRDNATDAASDVSWTNSMPMPGGGLVDTVFVPVQDAEQLGATFRMFQLHPTGNAGEYHVVYDSGDISVNGTLGLTAALKFPNGPANVQAGDVFGHYGRGIPFSIGSGAGFIPIYYPSDTLPPVTQDITLGVAPYPVFAQDRDYAWAVSFFSGTLVGTSLTPRVNSTDGSPQVLWSNFISMPSAGSVDAVYVPIQAADQFGAVFRMFHCHPTGAANEFEVLYDSGPIAVTGNVGQVARLSFPNGPTAVTSGDVFFHYGRGIPFGDGPIGIYYPVASPPPVGPLTVATGLYPAAPYLREYAWSVHLTPAVKLPFEFTAAHITATTLSLTWNSESGGLYALDYSTDLATWSEADDNVPSQGALTTYTKFPTSQLGARFLYFRVRDMTPR